MPPAAQRFGQSALLRNLFGLALAVAVAVLLLVFSLSEDIHQLNILSAFEAKLIDQRFRIRGPRVPSGQVAVIAIDSKSIEAIGRWPWTRAVHARLIDKLRAHGASTVAFDVLFTEMEGKAEADRLRQIAATVPDGEVVQPIRDAINKAIAEVEVDRVFAAAMEKTFEDDAALTVLSYDFVFPEDLSGTSQLGQTFGSDQERAILDIASYLTLDKNVVVMRTAPPSLALGLRPVITTFTDFTAMLGFANQVQDKDATLRRVRVVTVYSPAVRTAYTSGLPLDQVLRDPSNSVQGFMPLSLAALTTHLRLPSNQLNLDLPAGELRLGSSDSGKPARSITFDTDDGTTPIDYYGASQSIVTYPFIDVLNDQLVDASGTPIDGKGALAGKLVFVGATDPGLGDFFPTPFTSRLAGVEVHAHFAENVLEGRQIRRHKDAELVTILVVTAAAILVGLLSANLGPLVTAVIALGALGGYYAYTQNDFNQTGMVWNWTLPGLTVGLAFAGTVASRQIAERRARRAMEARSEFVQNTFGRYLTDSVVTMLLDSPEGLKLGGQKAEITILMSDLRGFTALCEQHPPEVVISMLNYYLGTMADTVLKYGGTVDEFIGDAVLALFGVPVKTRNDAARAVACAIEMQRCMEDVNRYCREQTLPELEMGIALNTGEVIVGNIGSERRSKYGVVGSNVNLTSRIESYSVGGQVLVSGATLAQAGDIVEVSDRIDVIAKGLAEPIPAYVVEGIGGEFNLRMPEVVEVMVPLPEPIEVKYSILEGKLIGALMTKSTFVQLSKLGADMVVKKPLSPLTNLKLKVLADGKPMDEDLYAKVISRETADGTVALRFTSVPPALKKHLQKIREAAEGKASPLDAKATPRPS